MSSGKARVWMTVVLLVAISQAQAQIYRWVDDRGVTHFSTTPPPETSLREHQIYDRQGRVQRQLDAPPTEAEREREREARERGRIDAEQRSAEQERQRAEAAELQGRMRQLDQVYSSPEDILEQRDRRLEQIATTLKMSEGFIATLEGERDRISGQIQRHVGVDGTLERYRAELSDVERRLARERLHQDRQRAMMAEIEAGAALDLADYERLISPLRESR